MNQPIRITAEDLRGTEDTQTWQEKALLLEELHVEPEDVFVVANEYAVVTAVRIVEVLNDETAVDISRPLIGLFLAGFETGIRAERLRRERET